MKVKEKTNKHAKKNRKIDEIFTAAFSVGSVAECWWDITISKLTWCRSLCTLSQFNFAKLALFFLRNCCENPQSMHTFDFISKGL